jgi:hypothetical protein
MDGSMGNRQSTRLALRPIFSARFSRHAHTDGLT